MHLEALGYTTDELANLLAVHESELLSLYGIGGGGDRKAKFTILR